MTSVCRVTEARPWPWLRAVIRDIGPRLVVADDGTTPPEDMWLWFWPRYSIQNWVVVRRPGLVAIKVGPARQTAAAWDV